MTSIARRTQVITTTRLVFRYEVELRRLNDDAWRSLDLEGWVNLFMDVALDPYMPFREEKITDFVVDLMMYDITRDDADRLFRTLLRRTKAYIERVTGDRICNLSHQWRWLDRQKTAVILIDRC